METQPTADADVERQKTLVSYQEAITEFLSRRESALKHLDGLVAAHLSGTDILDQLCRMGRDLWFVSVLFLLSIDGTAADKWIASLSLDDPDKEHLKSIHGNYHTPLGRMAGKFFDRYMHGLTDPVDYVDTSGRFNPSMEEVILEVRLFSADRVMLHFDDTASSLVWLAERLIDDSLDSLEWAKERGLPMNDVEKHRLRRSKEKIAKHLARLEDLHVAPPNEQEGPEEED